MAHVPAATGPLDLEVLDAWRQFTPPFVQAFPDLRLTVPDIRCRGEHGGRACGLPRHPPRRVPGIPPTDKEVAFSSIVFNHIVDGRVEENWVEIDLLRLLGQLGTIPELEHSEEANPT